MAEAKPNTNISSSLGIRFSLGGGFESKECYCTDTGLSDGLAEYRRSFTGYLLGLG